MEERLLRRNLSLIQDVARQSGAEIILAFKAFALWKTFPIFREYITHTTASSPYEARLAKEEFGSPAHTYSPAYTEDTFGEILSNSSHITFNSLSQYEAFFPKVEQWNREHAGEERISCGLRINPEHSHIETDLYNPTAPGSRFGVISGQMPECLPSGIEGFHCHCHCESSAEDLADNLIYIEERFGRWFPQLKWLNLGGGHLMTRQGYNVPLLIETIRGLRQRYPNLRIILEPGSAFTWRTGELVATVEDVVCHGGQPTAMLNVSFACHMPDCLEMPYKPAIIGMHDPIGKEVRWYMGGNSCLAGDYVGCWSFDERHWPKPGDLVVFRDMIHYTMVKTTMFNGVTHPSIVIYHPEEDRFEVIRRFGYEDYKHRMG